MKFIVPNLSYSNNLIKIRVVLGVLRHAESKSSLYFVLSLFLKEVLVILCWNPWQLFQVSETRHVFGRNKAVRFCRITPFLQTIGNAIDFRFFWKNITMYTLSMFFFAMFIIAHRIPSSFLKKRIEKRINIGFGTKITI